MEAEPNLSGSVDICPFVVCRIDEDALECAIWRLEDGRQSLALFLGESSAQSYIEQAGLGEQWKTYCPGREDLLEIIRQAAVMGVHLAALDPSTTSAKRLFKLDEVITRMADG